MDSLKVSATSFGTFGVWYLDFIPFILQIIIAIMTRTQNELKEYANSGSRSSSR